MLEGSAAEVYQKDMLIKASEKVRKKIPKTHFDVLFKRLFLTSTYKHIHTSTMFIQVVLNVIKKNLLPQKNPIKKTSGSFDINCWISQYRIKYLL